MFRSLGASRAVPWYRAQVREQLSLQQRSQLCGLEFKAVGVHKGLGVPLFTPPLHQNSSALLETEFLARLHLQKSILLLNKGV